MAGIVFLRTRELQRITRFYTERMRMQPWLSQNGIEILHHDGFLVGFHQAGTTDSDALLTFVYRSRQEVDRAYEQLQQIALAPPDENGQYGIYNFFGRDPEGRKVEVQAFLHELPAVPRLFEEADR